MRILVLLTPDCGLRPGSALPNRASYYIRKKTTDNATISVILGISRPTVAKHLLSARQRLDVMNRAHLIGEAIRQKIIR